MRKRQKYIVNSIILLALLSAMFACDSMSSTKISQEEQAKLDSLFFGIKFGQSDNEFFEICRKLNHEGVLMGGNTRNYVMYRIESEDDPSGDIRMHFYPGLNDEKRIIEMDLEFSFYAWAPWNKQYQSDSLNSKIRTLLTNWYPGNDFRTDEEANKWIKKDHTRIIELSEKDSEIVKVRIYKFQQ